jgi:hypothetical protein
MNLNEDPTDPYHYFLSSRSKPVCPQDAFTATGGGLQHPPGEVASEFKEHSDYKIPFRFYPLFTEGRIG